MASSSSCFKQNIRSNVKFSMSHSNLLNEFNWGGLSPMGTQFLLRPVNEDLMRLQANEFNEQVRRSAYGFEVITIINLQFFQSHKKILIFMV